MRDKLNNFVDTNLCKLSFPRTNLFCEGNQSIEREKMPQLIGIPIEGKLAFKLPRNNDGQVDGSNAFEAALTDNKTNVVHNVHVYSDVLKSTQNELILNKVEAIFGTIQENTMLAPAPIYISRDGYVLDGHHRWAAFNYKAIKTNEPQLMAVNVINMDMAKLLTFTNEFLKNFGIQPKSLVAEQQ